MNTIVVKFGGSSLASAQQFRKVADIIKADPARRYVVASAPGKRDDADTKVTDMLYACYDKACAGEDYAEALQQIKRRFADIAEELNIEFPVDEEIEIIRQHLAAGPRKDYMASRGEYLNSRLLAQYMGFKFIDAASAIRFNDDGTLDPEATYAKLPQLLKEADYAVVPGFYGAQEDGTIRTFSRGGSDVTGSIVARAAGADLYENWTDVSGMLMADPRVVKNPRTVEYISYRELRELSYMGASVLHEDAVFPCRACGIPINIRNTNAPQDKGTMIVSRVPETAEFRPITGIAGHKGLSSILIEKAMMNAEIGFGRKVLQAVEDNGLPFEHLPSGIDTMSVVVATAALNEKRQQVLDDITDLVHPDHISIEDDLAMIAVVGHGMVANKGTAAKVLTAITKADINVRVIDQGSSELNIIVGVSAADCDKAIAAIYEEFMG